MHDPEHQPGTFNDKSEKPRSLSKAALLEAKDALSILGASLFDDSKSALRRAGNAVKNTVSGAVHGALDKLGADPSAQKTTVAQLVRILPIIGATTTFADARKIWDMGVRNNDEKFKALARETCLSAIADAGIDIALLGSKLFHGIANVARGVVGPLIGTRAGRVLGAQEADPVMSFAGQLAAHQPAKAITEYLLTKLTPVAQGENTQAVIVPESAEADLEEIIDDQTTKGGGDPTPNT